MPGKIKWGVIGSGGIARRRTIPEGISKAGNAELTAVFDINTQVNAEVAKEFGAKQLSSIEELLNTDIDAVYIATPAHLHGDQVRASAKAGKHILCEKPLGMTVAETQQMIEICGQNKVKLGCAFMISASLPMPEPSFPAGIPPLRVPGGRTLQPEAVAH